jgi:hypothetical protein
MPQQQGRKKEVEGSPSHSLSIRDDGQYLRNMGITKSINGDAAISRKPNNQGRLSHMAAGSMVAAAINPKAAIKKNSGRSGRCHAENQSKTTQNAIINPTVPMAIHPKVTKSNKWIR